LQTDIEGKAGTSYFAISSRGGQQANTPLWRQEQPLSSPRQC
jgi:hypothetical protein